MEELDIQRGRKDINDVREYSLNNFRVFPGKY
jgi:hypothetical protein